MREIKFRAWDIKNKNMIYNIGIEIKQIYFNGMWKEWDLSNFIRNNDFYILMQYTGLKDKNDKEIYEGDIIVDLILERDNNETPPILIGWDDKYASFSLLRDGWLHNHFFGEGVDNKKIQKIGNIYENPELLK